MFTAKSGMAAMLAERPGKNNPGLYGFSGRFRGFLSRLGLPQYPSGHGALVLNNRRLHRIQ
jgi:hypothetical protein